MGSDHQTITWITFVSYVFVHWLNCGVTGVHWSVPTKQAAAQNSTFLPLNRINVKIHTSNAFFFELISSTWNNNDSKLFFYLNVNMLGPHKGPLEVPGCQFEKLCWLKEQRNRQCLSWLSNAHKTWSSTLKNVLEKNRKKKWLNNVAP